MSAKRIGLGKLSDFGAGRVEPEDRSEPLTEQKAEQPKQEKRSPQEKLSTINIKIREDQRSWLDNTSRIVRDNNENPVPPPDRVYPQHLIQVAIELLKSADINWKEIRNVEELKEKLNL